MAKPKIDITGLSVKLNTGETLDTSSLAGKVVLIVNVASKCGFTPQYEALEALNREYGPRGLAIIGFPTDQFKQELGTDEAIEEFCKLNYGVTFPMSQKVMVNGRERHPLFERLTKSKDAIGLAGPVLWNFEKFLVLPNGEVKRFRSVTRPDDSAIVEAIQANLV